MQDKNIKRISRLTAILTQLQSKRIVTATSLAEMYEVNVRTIYRDIKVLEASGIPIITEEGKGYAILDGYRIPPVMFTEREALALVTANQIIATQKDSSFRKEFGNAIGKIKSVLKNYDKVKTEILETNLYVGKNPEEETNSHSLMDIQMAIATNKVIGIEYKNESQSISARLLEPYLLYYSNHDNWVICAWCTLRNDFRSFRLDRIIKYAILDKTFTPNKRLFNHYIKENFLN
ncbi:helix-turn-helix transcriptional regulator [Anditalea andensis]|uniref:HTH deoR-type domain-containing protein n=1 Tax=Anditalea andensis TaxID=1048983 RepID=A0A074KWU2_9BACT|nr:YafY family protein [Anditalea andensis]KEO72665.1 hypothetical protein EL17_18165 [Anditalea andensis]